MEKISLAAARVNAKYTITEVSEKIGRSVSTICQWEAGTTEPKIGDAVKLAELYGVDVYCIKFGKEAAE